MYIAPRTKAYAHLDRLAGWQHGQKPAPVTVEWDLSNVCSLGCQFCHFAHTHVAGPWAAQGRDKPRGYSDTGRMADVAIVERALSEMALVGVRAIVWSGGGEPTLHPAFGDISDHAHTLGLEQGIYTLGGHLTPELAATLSRTLSWAVVSLDCADAWSYAQEKKVPQSRFFDACHGIQLLTLGVPVVGASFLLHAGNWSRTAEMLALARSLGATYTTFRPTVETKPSHPSVCDADRSWVTSAEPFLVELAAEQDVEIDVDRFIEYRDWQSHGYSACHGIKLLTQVTPDGRVWVCPNRRGVMGSELGNLTTESFAAIWAKHPGAWTDFADCRVMCRLHLVNASLAPVFAQRKHEAFV